MKRVAFLACFCVCGAWAQTSNVQTVKGWTRTYIMGVPGGSLRDPTGNLADWQRAAAVSEVAAESSNIVGAAGIGLTNALERLWAVADNTNNFTGRLYIAADMDDDPEYPNLEAFVLAESAGTNGTHHFYAHYTRVLADPPRTTWSFATAPGVVYWSAGSIDTNTAMTNISGYACYDIQVTRPEAVGNIILRTHKFMKWGTPDGPLDIPDDGLEVIFGGETNRPYTGVVVCTNGSTESVETYLSGFLYKTITNHLEETP